MKTPGLRHSLVREFGRFSEVRHAGQKVSGSGQLAWRDHVGFSTKHEQVQALDRRSTFRESFGGFAGLTQTRSRECADRKVEVGASEVSCVSLDRVDGLCPS